MNFSFPDFGLRGAQKPDEDFDHSSIDRLTYAIGDIHGRQDLFRAMLELIQNDAETLGERARLVLLGDYIDRGPASSIVLETIVELRNYNWCDLTVLLGNHEYFLVKFLMDYSSGEAWIENGGLTFLSSYGLRPPRNRSERDQWRELRDDMLSTIPRPHLRMLYDSQLYLIAGDYMFVHAGVKPGVPIETQDASTLLWIRDEFLQSKRACEYVVVHGHSAKTQPENLPWRIGIDTGAYATDTLTAVRLNENQRGILQVSL